MTLLLALLLLLAHFNAPPAVVPNVLDMDVKPAKAMIERSRLVPVVLCVTPPEGSRLDPGTVGVTDPLPGTKVKRGSSVLMVVVGPCEGAATGESKDSVDG